jgi:hypothetical protein
MKRIAEFEKDLVERVNLIEGSNDTGICDFTTHLCSNGEIEYKYISVVLGCTILTRYEGWRVYGDYQPLIMRIELKYSVVNS